MKDNHFTRREVLRIGGLSVFAPLAISTTASASRSTSDKVGNGNSCILVFLQGGPSHIDLWDPKPTAPREVRGVFEPIRTAVPGMQFGELLPRLSRIAKHIAVIRSMTHKFNNHIAGTYIMQTGSTNQPNADREAAVSDFPGPGAVLSALRQKTSKLPVSVSLPNWLSIPGPSNRMPGQFGGFLGSTHDPFLIQGNPNKAKFKPLNLSLPGDVDGKRFDARRTLLAQFDAGMKELDNRATRSRDRLYATAMEMLTDPRIRMALDLTQESKSLRNRYGRTKLGQSLLLARRLVESGVTFVAVNEFNQAWDHHSKVERNLKSRAPQTDQGVGTLIEDLAERGLLDSTLVINTGEFGRAPKINTDGGRDHWSRVYSTMLAGGGIRGGQVLGRSDNRGAFVAERPVRPADLLATMWTTLGVDPHAIVHDRLNRPRKLTQGRVLTELL